MGSQFARTKLSILRFRHLTRALKRSLSHVMMHGCRRNIPVKDGTPWHQPNLAMRVLPHILAQPPCMNTEVSRVGRRLSHLEIGTLGLSRELEPRTITPAPSRWKKVARQWFSRIQI